MSWKQIGALLAGLAALVSILTGLRQLGWFDRDRNPVIELSRDTAPRGGKVTVTGRDFCPDELVDISVFVHPAGTTSAARDGSFTKDITVPAASFPPSDFPAFVTAVGQTCKKPAQAPFTIR